jgi:hypothetical protein
VPWHPDFKALIILAAGLTLALPARAIDWSEMLKGVLGQPASGPTASGVDALSNADINAGLKEALTRGAEAAVAQLGQKDGFFGNAVLKIPLPPSLQKAEKAMRMLGMGKQADELVLSMNRAAEAAVPEAKTLLVSAVKEMTLEDARGILTGGQTSATDFFRKKTETNSPGASPPSSRPPPTRSGWRNSTTSTPVWPRSIWSTSSRPASAVSPAGARPALYVIGEKRPRSPTPCRLAAIC